MTAPLMPDKVEALAAEIHRIYQIEALRQNDIRHPDDYEKLSEGVKNYDRVLARFIIFREAEAWKLCRELAQIVSEVHEGFEHSVKDCDCQAARILAKARESGVIE